MNKEIVDWAEYSRELIQELLADGTDEEAYHTIEHHFASDNFDALEQFAVAAFKQGFDVSEPEEAELETGEKIFAFDIVTEHLLESEKIIAEVNQLLALAGQYHVDYDGWGTYFEE